MTDISISIVVYNGEADVREAITSIERFTDPSLSKKIYITDNSDRPNNLREFAQEFDDVEYVPTGGNIGFGAGHNFVKERLTSRYHAIVNPDIIFKEDALSALVKFMDESGAGMCVPRLIGTDGELLSVYRREPTVTDMFLRMFVKHGFEKRKAYHTMQDMDYSKPFRVPFAQGSFLVIRTELFKELGGFDERYFMYMEDADLCKRVNAVADVMYCPYASVIHKWEKGSHKNRKLFKIHVKSMIRYFAKWNHF